jgi:hypothetical protein
MSGNSLRKVNGHGVEVLVSSPGRDSEFCLHQRAQTGFSCSHSLLFDENQVLSELHRPEGKAMVYWL